MQKNITPRNARKFVRTSKISPEFKRPETMEACTIPISKAPFQLPFPVLHFAKTEFFKTPTFHIACSEPVYMALAGLQTGSWKLTAEVARSAIVIDGDLDAESQTHSSARAFLTNRFDDRYPHTLQLSSHNLDGLNIVVGSVFDFQFNNRSCVLDSGHEIDRRRIQLKILLNSCHSLIHAPLLKTETGSFVLRSCDLYDVEPMKILNDCDMWLHRLQSNLQQVKVLGDGNYEIHGHGEDVVGIVETTDSINKQLPFQKYEPPMRWQIPRAMDYQIGPYDVTESAGALGPGIYEALEYKNQVLNFDTLKDRKDPKPAYDVDWTTERAPLWCEATIPNGGYITFSKGTM